MAIPVIPPSTPNPVIIPFAKDVYGNYIGITKPDSTILRSATALYQSAVPITAPLNTSNNILSPISITGGIVGIDGRLRITMLWSFTNNSNTKSIRARFGGSYIYTAGLGSQTTCRLTLDITNRHAANSQICTQNNVGGTDGYSSQPFTFLTVDTTVSQILQFECQKSTASDSIVLEGVFIEVINP